MIAAKKLILLLLLTFVALSVQSKSRSKRHREQSSNSTSFGNQHVKTSGVRPNFGPQWPTTANLTFEEVNLGHASDAIAAKFFKLQPVYVSMTTISKRIDDIGQSIRSIFEGDIVPHRFYLVVSREPFLLDAGITTIPKELIELGAKYPISIVFTNNIGPHRKLLPLLQEKWNEDCVLVTFDDDLGDRHDKLLLSRMLQNYLTTDREAVIAYRARRIGFCSSPPYTTLSYHQWSVIFTYGNQELFVLPTGAGGILYRPRFFHPIVFNSTLRELTSLADDIMFRLSTLATRTPVVIACRDVFTRHKVLRKCPNNIEIANPMLGKLPLLSYNCNSNGSNNNNNNIKQDPNAVVECGPEIVGTTINDEDRARDKKLAKKNAMKMAANNSGNTTMNTANVNSGAVANGMLQSKRKLNSKNSMEIENVKMEANESDNLLFDSNDMSIDNGSIDNDIEISNESNENGIINEKNTNRKLSNISNKATLYSMNSRGRNDLQWKKAVEFLMASGTFDINSLVDSTIVKERKLICENPILGKYCAFKTC